MPSSFSNGRALIIGIAQYAPPTRSLPKIIENDATDIAAILKSPERCGFETDKVRILLSSEATKEAIVDEFDFLAANSDPEETVLIYFSGHGGQVEDGPDKGNYLIPHDYDPQDRKGTALSSEEVSTHLKAVKAKRLVVLFDACHSGGTGDVKSTVSLAGMKSGINPTVYQQLSAGVGRVIIASSRSEEVSWCLSGMSNSLFTHYLIEALKGKCRTCDDGLIRVFDVFEHVSLNVPDKVSAPPISSSQHPIFKAHDMEDNFAIALDCGGTKNAGNGSSVLSNQRFLAENNWREIEAVFYELYPQGPMDEEIWNRAGGNIAFLSLKGSGKAMWHNAIQKIRKGGGGDGVTITSLLSEALEDFPQNQSLQNFIKNGELSN